MKTLFPWFLSGLVLAIPGCSGESDKADDSATSGDSDTGEADAAIVPTEGDWTFGSGSWVSDECEASFLSTPVGWALSNATETDFDLSFQFAEAGSILAEPSCTLESADYTCETVVQKFSIGANSIVLKATAVGSFSSDIAASLEVTFDIECSGSGCNGMLSSNPCTSVQSFNSFYDG